MKRTCVSGKLTEIAADVIVVPVFDGQDLIPEVKDIDEKLSNAISKKIGREFRADPRQVCVIDTLGLIPARNIALVGLGQKSSCTHDVLRRVAGHTTRVLRDQFGFSTLTVALHLADQNAAQAVIEGAILGSYQFTKYKTVDTDKIRRIEELAFVGDVEGALNKGSAIAEGVFLTRDVVNEPPSTYTPEALANKAKELESLGVKVTVMDKAQIAKKGLIALLAVNNGSVNEPRFVVMEYNGGGSKKIALVGKGITFDSGGLNLKPGDSMLTMKMDMAGAGTVLGAIKAAASLKLGVNVVGVIACTENMPGSNAYKPGDIIGSYGGKTIEVLNTDAEGRIVLADALTYAEKDVRPDMIVDLATLTGAAVVSLGNIAAPVLGDESVVNELLKAGEVSGDKTWALPLWPEYQEMVKSDLADVRNLGNKARHAGTIMGAAFLRNFVDKTPWGHIDIAGPAWSDEDKDYLKKGGTGFGVRLLVSFLERHA